MSQNPRVDWKKVLCATLTVLLLLPRVKGTKSKSTVTKRYYVYLF